MTSIPLKKISERFKTRQREALWPDHPEIWCEDHGLFLWSMQKLVAESVVNHKKTLVVTGNGVGKATLTTDRLPTPTGWTTVGDVKVGEYVLDERGYPTKVTAKSPVWNIPLVKVVFNDGAEVICSLHHEWVVIDIRDIDEQTLVHIEDWRDLWHLGKVLETGQIMSQLNETQFYIPVNGGDMEVLVPAGNYANATRRLIVDIVPTYTEPSQCIEVDSPSHMYLVGEHMIPTHNSRLSATLCGWWVDTHPLHDTTVVTTATNWKQVRNVLWKEIPRVKQTAGIDGNITSDAQWKRGDRKDPVAFGMKPDDKDESGFQGIHDRYVLVIIDEAGGVSKEIFTAADAVTTNEHARILAIANPNDPSSYMATVFDKESKLPPEERSWNIIQFGAFDSPNFTGEKVPEEVASRLVRKEWVEARKREWGEDDPRYVARVLGQFPDVSDDGLFNLGRVLQSMNSYEDFDYDPNAPIRLGVDVARYGSDSSVITSYQDGKVSILKKLQNKNGPELAKIVGELATELKATEIRIDAVGVGVSVLDHIDAHVPPETKIIAIKGNAASPDSTKWYNWRAAMYDKFSRKVSMGEIALPNDEELYREIKSIRYLYRGSALLIESKEDMRRRKVHSPDILDAVIYASQDIEEAESDQETLVTVDDILEDFDFMPMSIFPG